MNSRPVIAIFGVLILCFVSKHTNADEYDDPIEPIDPKYHDDIDRIVNHLGFPPPNLSGVVKFHEVNYYLYTRTRKNVLVNSSNPEDLNITDKKLVFVVHGWTGNHGLKWIQDITNATLNNYDVAVIQVDWQKPAAENYVDAVHNVRQVGIIIGQFIVTLISKYDMDLDQISFVGHSLGAHVSGFVGKYVKSQLNHQPIAKILALDAAGPIFDERGVLGRLTKDDAQSVFVLHTDGGKFGYKESFGATDFFANTGTAIQPGCLDESTPDAVTTSIFCSHARSHRYYIESLIKPSPVGVQCTTYDRFIVERCDNNTALPFLSEKTIRGDFYFITDPEKPYIRSGRAGASDFIYNV